jgi:hypothetical protein
MILTTWRMASIQKRHSQLPLKAVEAGEMKRMGLAGYVSGA